MIQINGNGLAAVNSQPAQTHTQYATNFIAINTSDASSVLMHWTELPDKTGSTMTAHQGTWEALLDRLRTVGTFPSKDKCPWVKLAVFGDKRSASGSLRTNDNVKAVWGLEGDYDAHAVTMEQAAAMLEQYGIRAALYPSPSNTADRPRWRVICPLSNAHTPEQRHNLVARLNQALGGILSKESFTLSQGYFFGAVPSNHYRVIATEGVCIDQVPEWMLAAPSAQVISLPASSGANKPDVTLEMTREMLTFISPDCGYVDWRNVGMGLAHQFGDAGFDLWNVWSQASPKYNERDMAAQWRSFKTDHPNGVTIGTVMHLARLGGWAGITPDLSNVFPAISTPAGTHPLANFKEVSFQPRHPEFLIPGAIGMGLVVISGEAGVGKTSTLLPLAAMVAGIHEPDHPLAPRHWRHVIYIVEDVEQAQRILAGMATQPWFDGDAAHERLHLVDAVRMTPSKVAEVGRIYAEMFTRIVDGVILLPLVVIDTKSAVLDIDNENDNSETSRAIATLKQGFEKLAIWLIGHTAKASQGVTDAASLSSRGAGSAGADGNQTLFLVNDKGTRYLKRGKTRFEAAWDELQITSHTAIRLARDQWGDLAPLTLRWNSINPQAPNSAACKALRDRQAADADREKLQAQIVDLVVAGFEKQLPLNRAAIKSAIRRKSADVVNAIESLVSSGRLYEVDIPKDVRAHPKKSSYLVALTDQEREMFRETGRVPASKSEIVPSWTLFP